MRQRPANRAISQSGVVNPTPPRVQHCAWILLIHAPLGSARLAIFRAPMRDETLAMHTDFGAAPALAAVWRGILRWSAQ